MLLTNSADFQELFIDWWWGTGTILVLVFLVLVLVFFYDRANQWLEREEENHKYIVCYKNQALHQMSHDTCQPNP